MSRRRMRYIVAMSAVLATVAAKASPRIGLSFTGITNDDIVALGQDLAPPDTTGTAGPNHFAAFLNGGFAAYDKSTGALVGQKISDTQFWTNAGIFPGLGNLSDPRLIYDPTSSHWFAAQITLESTRNRVLLARSDSPDPTAGWKAVSFKVSGGFADFPMLGVDADGVYVSANVFDSRTGQSLTGASVFSIPKADLLSSTPSIARMTPFENLDLIQRGFTIQPVNDFGPSKGHGSLIAVDAIQLGKIDRTNIIGPAFANAALSPTTVIAAADESLPPLGRQPDGTQRLDFGNDNYLASVYQVGDSIWAVHGTDVNNHAAIRWTVLDEKTHAIIQEGTIADGRYDFLYPSIAGNQFGEAVIGYTRTGSGPTDFPGAFASIWTTADGVTTFGDPVLLQAGLANYHKFNSPLSPERWGDYSQTSIDPDNPHIFWTTQEFSMTVDRWGTQITQIIVPEPATAGLVLLASTLLLCWRRRA